MPDTPTPGQVCYDAYCLVIFGERPDLSHDYDNLAERTHRAWEAAAQAASTPGTWDTRAALDALRHLARGVVRHWAAFGPEHGFAEAVHALAHWLVAHEEDAP